VPAGRVTRTVADLRTLPRQFWLLAAGILVCLAGAAQGLGMGLAAFVPWPWTLACVVSISVGVVILIPITSTVVSRLAPAELRGRYMGAWTLVYMGGYALGPLLGGWALDALGGRGAYVAIAAAGLLGAALFPLLRGWTRAGAEGTGEREALEMLGD